MTLDINRSGFEVPREGNRIRRIVDGFIRALRRRSRSAVNQMKLITKTFALNIVTNLAHVRHAELLTSLLTEIDTRSQLSRTVTLIPFIREHIRLDRTTTLFSRTERRILNVVGIQIGGFSTIRSLGNRSQTIPGNTLRILAFVINRIKDALLDAHLKESFTSGIPFNYSHNFLLSESQ